MKSAFAWSVRRELWEHRAFYIAPLVVAALVIVAVLINARNVREKVAMLETLGAHQQQMAVVMPFVIAASLILLVSFVVGAFYCFDALNTERRDRSILFWKSMPVSDAATVLSKAFVPLAVQPAVGFAVALATQAVLLVLIVGVLGATGVELGPLWTKLPVFTLAVALLYGVLVHVLWYAPLYALFLLLSAWLRRPFLWFAITAIAVQILEMIAFRTSYASKLIGYRLKGAMTEAFLPTGDSEVITSLSQLDPVRFLTSPGLWVGLLAATAFIYAAIYLRRSRVPL